MDFDKIAKETAEYWKTNCNDEDFYKNCIESIMLKLNVTEGVMPNEVYEIWRIIEENYID